MSQDKCASIALGQQSLFLFRGKSVNPDLLPQLSGGTYVTNKYVRVV
jgi:hypothetical protein